MQNFSINMLFVRLTCYWCCLENVKPQAEVALGFPVSSLTSIQFCGCVLDCNFCSPCVVVAQLQLMTGFTRTDLSQCQDVPVS